MAVPKIEANIGGTWTDVTADQLDSSFPVPRNRVRVAQGVRIRRGRDDEQSAVSPGECTFVLNNQDGKYSTRNPLSPYFGQLPRNTPIRVGVDAMSDTFTRSVTDGWGTSSSGHAWTIVQGTASNFDVTGSAGTIATTAGDQVAVLPNSYGDVDVVVKISFSSLTGNPDAGIVVCWQDADNHYRYVIDNSGGGQLRIERWADGGTLPFKVLANASFTLSAGTDYWLRASFSGAVRAKVWEDGDDEPDWMAEGWLNNPAALNVPLLPRYGKVGLFAVGGSAGAASFDDLEVISYRFHGEVRSWPQRWDKSQADAHITVQAAGILNRLSSSSLAVLPSPMYREATKPSVTDVTAAYWPCEDESGATRCASAIPRRPDLQFIGPVSPGINTSIPGSKPICEFGDGGNFVGRVWQNVDTTGSIFFRIVLDVPEDHDVPNDTTLFNIYVTGGNVARFAVIYGTGGTLEVAATRDDNTVVDSTTEAAFNLDGSRCLLAVELVQDGSDCDALIAANKISDDGQTVSSEVWSETLTGVTIGRCYQVSGGGSGTMSGWGFGHIGVGASQDFMFSMADALVGNSGETAGNRAIRIAEEAGIRLQVIGDPDESPTMGAQIFGGALDVLRSCEAADGGILYESRNELGLTLRLLSSMYNQDGPTLDYASRQVNTFVPVDDDMILWNDVTVNRTNGSSARAELESGQLSTQEPPDGVGRIEAPSHEVALRYDEQLPDVASWRLHLGTWDEQRFSTIGVQHAAPALRADDDLRAQLAALDSGDMLAVDNPPAGMAPEQIRQLVQGYAEVIGEGGADTWAIDWTSTPYRPYQVAVWGSATNPNSTDTESRYDGAGGSGTQLEGSIGSSTTSLTVQTTRGQLWTTDADDMPFNIRLGGPGGEVCTVTAVSGMSSPQTFTVVRGVNGVQRTWPTGTDVELAESTVWAL